METRLINVLRELGLPPADPAPLAGDASERRFFRLNRPGGGGTVILVVFPEDTEEAELIRYTGTSHLLREAGLPVPGIYRRGKQSLLVEDCGDHLLQDAVRTRDPLPLYREAVDLILRMQDRVPAGAALNPPFDEEKFIGELKFFLDHTVSGFFREKITGPARAEWQRVFRVLAQELGEQTRVFCHRDFHSRNLLLQEESLRIIDFQDGRGGPGTYDLVSLLEDPYVSLTREHREELKDYFLDRLGPRGINFSGDFQRGYDMMALQRLLKAAGTFGYQVAVRGRRRYAAHLPSALNRAVEIMSHYPEFSVFREELGKFLRRLPRVPDTEMEI